MDHEAKCDCQFLETCPTFEDRMVSGRMKGPTGLGCTGQTDVYRGKHCRTFACAYLSIAVSNALRQPPYQVGRPNRLSSVLALF